MTSPWLTHSEGNMMPHSHGAHVTERSHVTYMGSHSGQREIGPTKCSLLPLYEFSSPIFGSF